MNWLDIILLVILAVAAFFGLRTGLIKAVLSLAGLIIGVILAGHYYDPVAGWLFFIPQPNLAKVAAFALILIATLIAASFAASVLGRIISITMLGWVNRLCGALFGFAMAAVTLGALLSVAASFPFFDVESLIRGSAIASALLQYFPLVLGLLPEEFDAARSFFV